MTLSYVDTFMFNISCKCLYVEQCNSLDITSAFVSNADDMFHQFKIKDDELLPYTEENDFINGTLFHA